MFNTIILKKGEAKLSKKEYENFQKGDTIFGIDADAEEVKRWSIEEEKQAKEELERYNCLYRSGYDWDIEEYALEYCRCDEDGSFIEGSDCVLAKESV